MNKWEGIGRLTRDPDVRYTTSSESGEQICIARYTLAIDRRKQNAGADYIPCVAFGKLGEFAEKYLHQGMKIGVSGRIQTGSYTNKEGNKVYTTDVIVQGLNFIGSNDKVLEEDDDDIFKGKSSVKTDEIELSSDDYPF